LKRRKARELPAGAAEPVAERYDSPHLDRWMEPAAAPGAMALASVMGQYVNPVSARLMAAVETGLAGMAVVEQ